MGGLGDDRHKVRDDLLAGLWVANERPLDGGSNLGGLQEECTSLRHRLEETGLRKQGQPGIVRRHRLGDVCGVKERHARIGSVLRSHDVGRQGERGSPFTQVTGQGGTPGVRFPSWAGRGAAVVLTMHQTDSEQGGTNVVCFVERMLFSGVHLGGPGLTRESFAGTSCRCARRLKCILFRQLTMGVWC